MRRPFGVASGAAAASEAIEPAVDLAALVSGPPRRVDRQVNGRQHRTVRAVPADRLVEERTRMRSLPTRMPDLDRRQVIRVAAQPFVRVDRNDYSINPAFAGRRVEVKVSQSEITAVVLDTGELAARHRRVFAGGLTFIDAAHQTGLERQRDERRGRHQVDVEIRPLSRYDRLIPA